MTMTKHSMTKVKVSEAQGVILDWMASQCNHRELRCKYGEPTFNAKTKRVYETEGLQQIGVNFNPSTNWSQGGPIIEREQISVLEAGSFWGARPLQDGVRPTKDSYGPTPLIAAMRCYVTNKLGDVVEVPDELV